MQTIPTPVHAEKLPDWFKDGRNIREIVIDDDIRDLAQSLATYNFLQPVGAVDYGNYGEVLYGNRRLAAYRYGRGEGLALPDTIPVFLYPPSLTAAGRLTVTATENLQRKDLADHQIFRLCKEMLELNGWTRKELAAHLKKHPSMVTHYLSPDGLSPEALQAFLDGKFGFSHAYAIKKSSDQANTLAKVLNGSSRAALEDENRKNRNGHAPDSATRLERIRIPVATAGAAGAVVLSVPQDSELAAVETLLKDAEKAVRLPRIKSTAASGDTPGLVTVTREGMDPAAETLLKEALTIVQYAKTRKLTLKVAQAEWKDCATKAKDAEPENANGKES